MSYPKEVLDAWSGEPGEARFARMRQAIGSSDELVLVAEDGQRVIGFGSVVLSLEELRSLYVHPDTWRRGVGAVLLAELERLATGRGLTIPRSIRSFTAARPFVTRGKVSTCSCSAGDRSARFMICVIRGWVTPQRRASSDWSRTSPDRTIRSKRRASARRRVTRGTLPPVVAGAGGGGGGGASLVSRTRCFPRAEDVMAIFRLTVIMLPPLASPRVQ